MSIKSYKKTKLPYANGAWKTLAEQERGRDYCDDHHEALSRIGDLTEAVDILLKEVYKLRLCNDLLLDRLGYVHMCGEVAAPTKINPSENDIKYELVNFLGDKNNVKLI